MAGPSPYSGGRWPADGEPVGINVGAGSTAAVVVAQTGGGSPGTVPTLPRESEEQLVRWIQSVDPGADASRWGGAPTPAQTHVSLDLSVPPAPAETPQRQSPPSPTTRAPHAPATRWRTGPAGAPPVQQALAQQVLRKEGAETMLGDTVAPERVSGLEGAHVPTQPTDMSVMAHLLYDAFKQAIRIERERGGGIY